MLREGFTTGTAAAAAAAAAAALLLRGVGRSRVRVALPPFGVAPDPFTEPEPDTDRTLDIAVDASGLEGDGSAWGRVIKDGGDDPDATHGAAILARVSRLPLAMPEGETCVEAGCYAGVHLCGGHGVGVVTLPGLPVPVGEAAINPQPRRQIAYAVRREARLAACEDPLYVRIEVPDGPERARKTLNARLGIVGGISILGTQGTVRPFSHEAWKATIDQGLAVASALGCPRVLLSTGRRSERLGRTLHPDLSDQACVQVADFAAHSMRAMAGYAFCQVIWVCFPGKLLKLAQGLEWTHASAGAADLDLLARICADAGGSNALVAKVRAMPTAAGGFGLLEDQPDLLDRVTRALARMACTALHGWLTGACPAGAAPQLLLHVFSSRERLLLSLPGEQCGRL